MSRRYFSGSSANQDPDQFAAFQEILAQNSEKFSNSASSINSQELPELAAATYPFYQQHQDLAGEKVMVLFSGGLDTSFMAHFLRNVIRADVTTFSANVGSVTAPVNMQEIEERSKELGVQQHVELDCRDYLSGLALKAVNAEATLGMYGHHPASSLARVAICEGALRFAKENGITALMHGSNGSQNNPYRFMSALKHFGKLLEHEIEELSPNLGQTTVPRAMEASYLNAMGISVKSAAFEKNISHDRNLLGDEWEEDFIADPSNSYDVRYTALKETPLSAGPRKIAIKFEQGLPVAIKTHEHGAFEEKPITAILEELNEIGLPHQIGIFDYPESRPIGINAREIHIAPAMDILVRAHNWLRSYNLDRSTNVAYDLLSKTWSDLVLQQNLYLSPEREEIDSLLASASRSLNGEVHLTLENGLITNFNSPHADLLMEGRKAAASKDFVESHLQTGADPFTRSVIGICRRSLQEMTPTDELRPERRADTLEHLGEVVSAGGAAGASGLRGDAGQVVPQPSPATSQAPRSDYRAVLASAGAANTAAQASTSKPGAHQP